MGVPAKSSLFHSQYPKNEKYVSGNDKVSQRINCFRILTHKISPELIRIRF